MNLAVAFAENAEKFSRIPALIRGQDEFSYASVLQRAQLCAHNLASDFGVKPGDRVALWVRNCPEFVACLFGILGAGATVVPINTFLKPDEVAYIINDASAHVLITEAAMREPLVRVTELCAGLRIQPMEQFSFDAPLETTPPVFRSSLTEGDLAIIIYTSGTTGHPKGAMLSHSNLLHNVQSCQEVLKITNQDRFVAVLPMFHSFTLTVSVLLPLLTGSGVIVMKSVHQPKLLFQEIMDLRGTVLAAVPQFYRFLISQPCPPSLPLRICICGGAPLPVELLREFNAKMPLPLLEGYGLSETSPVASLNPINAGKEGSVGIPIPRVEMSVQDDNGQMMKPGETGEICIRGGNVMLGYWNQPLETAKVFRNGWLLTGDVGYRDKDDYFYVTDRKKDMLIVNGINVYPREIEEVLHQLPFVREVAVIGAPDPRRGEHPVAFVTPKEGQEIDIPALLRFAKSKLADYKVPKNVIEIPALPRNSTGKILKSALRTML